MASGNYFGTNGQLQPDILSAGRQFNSQTLSSGVITYTYTLVILSSESGTTDDLTTISSADAGDTIIIKAASGHTITAKTTGNIGLDADYEISGDATLTLVYDGTTWLPIGASAGGGDHNVDYAFVDRTANQTISTSTSTAVQFNRALDDNNALWDSVNYYFDIATTGIYTYDFDIMWQNNSTGYRKVTVETLSGGSTYEKLDYNALGSAINGNNGTNGRMKGSGTTYLVSGQKLRLNVLQTSGSSLFIVGGTLSGSHYSYFKIARLGARS